MQLMEEAAAAKEERAGRLQAGAAGQMDDAEKKRLKNKAKKEKQKAKKAAEKAATAAAAACGGGEAGAAAATAGPEPEPVDSSAGDGGLTEEERKKKEANRKKRQRQKAKKTGDAAAAVQWVEERLAQLKAERATLDASAEPEAVYPYRDWLRTSNGWSGGLRPHYVGPQRKVTDPAIAKPDYAEGKSWLPNPHLWRKAPFVWTNIGRERPQTQTARLTASLRRDRASRSAS